MIRTDVELGDLRENPNRFGGYGRKPLFGEAAGRWQYGFAIEMPIGRFRLGAVVAFQIDGRTFVGQVVEAHEESLQGSTRSHLCSIVKVEGAYQ